MLEGCTPVPEEGGLGSSGRQGVRRRSGAWVRKHLHFLLQIQKLFAISSPSPFILFFLSCRTVEQYLIWGSFIHLLLKSFNIEKMERIVQ